MRWAFGRLGVCATNQLNVVALINIVSSDGKRAFADLMPPPLRFVHVSWSARESNTAIESKPVLSLRMLELEC